MKLKLEKVSKQFGTHPALCGVSLDIEKCRSLALIGPSGSGKTTLLRILAGLETPGSGQVELDWEQMAFDEASLLRHRRSVGVVFQAFNLFPHLTALDNVILPLEKVHGHTPESARDTAMEWLRRFQLEKHAEKKPGALSGGQRQRIAIARAVAIRPKILLFDEPTSALDPEMTAEVLDLIRQLIESGVDSILVTHEMGFAPRVAERVVLLAGGPGVESGPAQELFAQPQREETRNFLATVLKY